MTCPRVGGGHPEFLTGLNSFLLGWQVQKAESFGINGRIGSFGYGEAVETTTMTTAFHVTKLAKQTFAKTERPQVAGHQCSTTWDEEHLFRFISTYSNLSCPTFPGCPSPPGMFFFYLGGGFTYFLCSPLFGEDSHFD